MKAYYNDITSGNLHLIRSLQKQISELKSRAINNKKIMLDYVQENQVLFLYTHPHTHEYPLTPLSPNLILDRTPTKKQQQKTVFCLPPYRN